MYSVDTDKYLLNAAVEETSEVLSLNISKAVPEKAICIEVVPEMNDNYYTISVADGVMYLRGGHTYSTILAVKRFEALVTENETISFANGYVYHGEYSKDAAAYLGDGYKITWLDEFDGNSIDNWNSVENQMSGVNGKTSVTTTESITVSNGVLEIKPSYDENYYYGGELSTKSKMSYQYGYVEAKMQIPDINGFLSAFWMRTTNAGSSEEAFSFCEVDVFERLNSGDIKTTIHKWDVIKDGETVKLSGGELTVNGYNRNVRTDLDGNWHIIGVEWTQSDISLIVDGVKLYTYDYTKNSALKEILDNNGMYLLLSLYTGKESNIAAELDSNADWTQSFKIDYIHLYQNASGKLSVK